MRLERVLQMPVSELIVRGRQEAAKWLDRIAVPPGPASTRGRAPRDGTAIVPSRFFEGAAHAEATVRLIERIPGSRERIIAAADAILGGRFDLLGYRGLDFGDPVDWHLDPVSKRRAPRIHWSRIDTLDPAVVGDPKVIWELNRHQWLLSLGQAYRLTGDECYASAFARYIGDWMHANPVGIGINWASSLEVALRLISWCWALVLFEDSRPLSGALLAQIIAGIDDHARRVERYLSDYFSPNTHLTGEAVGLFYAGVLFPDLPRAAHWRDRGMEILVTQCARHILPDGVYFEQSTCYQRYTAEIYLHFLMLAARNRIPLPGEVGRRLTRLLDFLLAVRQPDGSVPQIGDADGGWLLPLVSRAPDDTRGIFAVAAALFGRPDYAWAAGGVAPEVCWVLGPAGVAAFEALTPAPPQTAPSQLFPDGGYAIMRNGWQRDAHQLIFDVGPLGCPVNGAHGHADLLSVQCAIFGTPALVDPGAYTYTPHPEWRDFFRSTAAHSTVRIDGGDQALPAGPFKWQARPHARLTQWRSTAAFDFADAEHRAYTRLADPVMHRRRVLFVKPRYWVIVDDLDGTTAHEVELGFQLAPCEVTVHTDLWARAHGAGGPTLLIRPFATVPLRATVHEAEFMPIRGWVSPDYGQRLPAPRLTFTAEARLPLRIMTLLLPLADRLASPPSVSPGFEDGAGPLGLRFMDSGEYIRLDPQGPVIGEG